MSDDNEIESLIGKLEQLMNQANDKRVLEVYAPVAHADEFLAWFDTLTQFDLSVEQAPAENGFVRLDIRGPIEYLQMIHDKLVGDGAHVLSENHGGIVN